MRLPNSAHTSRPWRIHELTRDFRLEDVWALPTSGGPNDFPRLVEQFASGDPADGSSRLGRTLWTIRWIVGRLLGWDRLDGGSGSRRPTLRDRLPADLREGPSGPEFDRAPFTSLYLTDDEWAAELVNRTVHGVMHMAWVPGSTGGYRGQMAVLVKPSGLLGTVYMAAIKPFRYLIVYPSLMREIEREWSAGAGDTRTRRARPPPDAAGRLRGACWHEQHSAAVLTEGCERLDDLVARNVVHHDAYDPNAAEGLDGMKRTIEPGPPSTEARGTSRSRSGCFDYTALGRAEVASTA